jgi:hypothetical protein
MGFNLDDYETVESRLEKWHQAYPDGRIETDIVEHNQSRFIVVCKLFKTSDAEKPFSSGVASEVIADRGVNATSALENCETSAIGRALANAGFATKGKRASREEMVKVNNGNLEIPKPKYGAPGSRSAAMEAALHLVSNKPSEDPKSVAWSVGETIESIGEVVDIRFDCRHGEMVKKEGTAKASGKPYFGYVCPSNDKSDQCAPKWAKITANGKWFFDEPEIQ